MLIDVSPFLMGYRVSFILGTFPIKEYMHLLNEFYDEFKKYEIEIVDGLILKQLNTLTSLIIIGN